MDIERYVTITIPNVLAGFSDVEGEFNEASSPWVAVDYLLNDLDVIRATFSIADEDGHPIDTMEGTITIQRTPQTLISADVDLDDDD